MNSMHIHKLFRINTGTKPDPLLTTLYVLLTKQINDLVSQFYYLLNQMCYLLNQIHHLFKHKQTEAVYCLICHIT